MKIVRAETLQCRGKFGVSEECREIRYEIRTCIGDVRWPPGTATLTIPNGSSQPKTDPQLVRKMLIDSLVKRGWHAGQGPAHWTRRWSIVPAASRRTANGVYVLDWPIGEIARAEHMLNKMIVGLMMGELSGAVVVLPTRALREHLAETASVEEIVADLTLWRSLPLLEGLLELIVVEQDAVAPGVQPIQEEPATR